MFTESFLETVAAIATIAVGGFSFATFVRQLPQHRTRAFSLLGVAIAAFIGTAMIVLTDWGSPTAGAASKNEELTSDAWNAFNAKDYKRAIEIADEVLGNFTLQAERDQRELETSGAPNPSTGKPRSGEEKQRTLERGLLNDVATCYFIKGQANDKLKKIDEAKKAYTSAAALTYARTWDPAGWFWSPSQAAKDRLTLLGRE
ncbi:MAG: hypothetical protein O2968_12925 [Acidobacteria bacterium]|nr:hypothetical protein [Acidobacteriota bacterium]